MMSIDFDKYIILYENCQLTKGNNRTLLIDFQRRNLEFIDNEIFNIFSHKNRILSVNQILNDYNDEEKIIIIEYFQFLIKEEYAFQCSKEEISFFPKLNLKWENPSEITNSIIDFENIPSDLQPYSRYISDLNDLGCEDIQIRLFNELSIDFLEHFLSFFNKTAIIRIDIVLKSADNYLIYKDLISKFPRVSKLQINSASKNKIININKTQQIVLTTRKIENQNSCGIVESNYFNLRLEHFIESNQFNTCLNRKICIDIKGNVKNCPAFSKSYGNINSINIHHLLKNKGFTKFWKIKKDKISVCKDCEFRHICSDCRAFQTKDYTFEKPIKCLYTPYLK